VADDLLDRMRHNPAGDWTIVDIEKLCRRYGLFYRRGRGTSHNQIKHPKARTIVIVPTREPIKSVYIRKLVSYIDAHGDAS